MIGSGRVLIAPTLEADSEWWEPVGYTDGPGLVTFDPDPDADEVIHVRPPSTVTEDRRGLTTFVVTNPDTFVVTNPDVIRALFGEPREPTYSLTVNHLQEPLTAPRKARRLTGKAYRQARRRYAREHRAWRRAGSPMVERMTYLPRVTLTPGEDH